MPKRRLNKEFLCSIISIIVALIIFIIGCNILKTIHPELLDNIGTSIVFAITLLGVCISYFWFLFMSICIIDIIFNNKKHR